MKKLLALFISLTIPLTAFASYTDVWDGHYKESIDNLSMYGIINGNGDGTFNPNGVITRSEFAKIASIVSNADVSDDEACLFTDVAEGFWANGYINCAAKNGLIIGYPDGTFHPYENLSYAQAVTVVLRLLGYGTEQLGNNYPGAYIKKAAELGLTDGLSFNPNDVIDRQTVCFIVDNALMCDINSSSRKEKLITNLDYSVSDECIILSSGKDNSELMSDEVATSAGTYKTLYDGISDYTSKTVKLVLNTDNKICGIIDCGGESKRIAVESIAGSQVAYREDGVLKTMSFDDTALVYYKLSKNNFGSVSGDITTGSVIDIYYKNGAYDYAVITEKTLLGPKIVQPGANPSQMWNYAANLRVIRDGYEKTLNDIKTYDVLYYDSELNTLYAYCDKVSGVYEKAIPTKAQIKSVTVSGTSYELETQDAVYALGEYSNSFKINDYVTLLLGKDGKVAGVAAKATETDNTNYGVLLSCDKKLVDKSQDYYLTVLTVTGQKQEFKTDRDYTSYRGRVINYKFENGYLKPNIQSENKSFSGDVDQNTKSIGGIMLAPDAKIIDIAYAPAVNETSNASAVTVELSEINKASLSIGDISCVKLDGNGKISFIVLNNVTMQGYKFGIITKYTKLSGSSTYTMNIGGIESTYNVSFVSNNSAGQPVMACIEDNKLLKVLPLGKLSTKGKVTEINSEYITIGGESYKLAKDAVVYNCDNNEFKTVDIDDLTPENISTPAIYADRTADKGGLVRIIKCSVK